MSLIKVSDLSLGYDSKVVAKDLNFEVNMGDYLCIVGENGSGKSTLMKTLLGLKKPLGGTIEFGDGLKSIDIGYLPQQSVVQKDFPASVYEIVISGLCKGFSKSFFYSKEDKKTVERTLERLGIASLKRRCYRELSGGQQQRVLLARALCATEKLILLDEPVAGLDPVATKEMYDTIQDINKDGVTVIMISHDIAAAVKYATNILHMGDDNVFSTKEEYLNSELGRSFAQSTPSEE